MEQGSVISEDGRWEWDGRQWLPRDQQLSPPAPEESVALVPVEGGRQLVTNHARGFLAVEGDTIVGTDKKKEYRIAIQDALLRKRLGSWSISSRSDPGRVYFINKPDNLSSLTQFAAFVDESRQGDELEVAERAGARALHGRAEKLLVNGLGRDERVLLKLAGINNNYGLVATDQRVMIIKVGWMTGQTLGGKVTSFAYPNITSVEVRTNMLTGVFEVAGGGMSGAEGSYWGKRKVDAHKAPNMIPIGKSQANAFQQAAALIRERMHASHSPAVATPAPSLADELTKLAALRDQGVLTHAEFATQKARLLGGGDAAS